MLRTQGEPKLIFVLFLQNNLLYHKNYSMNVIPLPCVKMSEVRRLTKFGPLSLI